MLLPSTRLVPCKNRTLDTLVQAALRSGTQGVTSGLGVRVSLCARIAGIRTSPPETAWNFLAQLNKDLNSKCPAIPQSLHGTVSLCQQTGLYLKALKKPVMALRQVLGPARRALLPVSQKFVQDAGRTVSHARLRWLALLYAICHRRASLGIPACS